METTETIQDQTTFEITGIERVPEEGRQHTQLWDTMWLWWSANSVVATVALGTLSAFFNLGFAGSILVIIIFNLLGALPVAFLSTLGPKTGLAQMPLTRFSFGYQGAKLPAVFNALACIGWSAVNSYIGASLIVAWSNGAVPQWAALLLLTIITTLISTFGYFIVHRYERFAWIPMFILFAILAFVAVPRANINVPATATGLALFAGVATFGGAIFGYAIGWSSYAADYTRYQPANTSSRRVFLYAFFGLIIPLILLESLGVLLVTAAKGDGIGALIADALKGNPLAGIVILLLAFSTIANNVPNDYSFALSTQVIGLHIKRWILTIVGAVAYLALALSIQQAFFSKFEGFLLLIAYWLGAWNAIVIIEHFLRKGRYPVEDYENATRLPMGVAAIITLIVSLAIAVLGINQADTIGFEGPLAGLLNNADIGFPLAIIAAVILYPILRTFELRRYKR